MDGLLSASHPPRPSRSPVVVRATAGHTVRGRALAAVDVVMLSAVRRPAPGCGQQESRRRAQTGHDCAALVCGGGLAVTSALDHRRACAATRSAVMGFDYSRRRPPSDPQRCNPVASPKACYFAVLAPMRARCPSLLRRRGQHRQPPAWSASAARSAADWAAAAQQERRCSPPTARLRDHEQDPLRSDRQGTLSTLIRRKRLLATARCHPDPAAPAQPVSNFYTSSP